MEKTAQSQSKSRKPQDFFGAFCFVVLIATVTYASLTAT